MSVYSVKGKGWRYDFTLKGVRHTESWFKTKKEAVKAERIKREEVEKPTHQEEIQIDTTFLDLVNLRLDHVKAYHSNKHYTTTLYNARKWVKRWRNLKCSEITPLDIQKYLFERRKVSAYTANQDLRYLRAAFNYGLRNRLINDNPTKGLSFFPVVKGKKYVPPKDDVMKVIEAGNMDEQQYLWTILLTAARVGEINNLLWDDIDFERRLVTLWTRKRKGGHKEPREVPMIGDLYKILSRRFESRDPEAPYVFWHRFWSRKAGQMLKGPYKDRKTLMAKLCNKAGVRHFRFHALRHLTASILDDLNVPIGSIQRILGHKNRQTTEIYLHSIGEAEREAMNRLEGSNVFQPKKRNVNDAPVNKEMPYRQRKVERPSYSILKDEIKQFGYVETGKKYGVSDNAVRKWVKAYERDAA